jgi:hypothetical protein
MNENTTTSPMRQKPRYFQRPVRRWFDWFVCIFSPRWQRVSECPLAQHLIFRGAKVGEQTAEYWVEENRMGKQRCFVREGGWTYEIDPKRLGDLPNSKLRDAASALPTNTDAPISAFSVATYSACIGGSDGGAK